MFFLGSTLSLRLTPNLVSAKRIPTRLCYKSALWATSVDILGHNSEPRMDRPCGVNQQHTWTTSKFPCRLFLTSASCCMCRCRRANFCSIWSNLHLGLQNFQCSRKFGPKGEISLIDSVCLKLYFLTNQKIQRLVARLMKITMKIRNGSKCAISHCAILSSSKGDINHVSCHIILHSWLLYTVIDLPLKKKAGRETQFFFLLFVVNSWQRPVIKLAIARLSSCSLL